MRNFIKQETTPDDPLNRALDLICQHVKNTPKTPKDDYYMRKIIKHDLTLICLHACMWYKNEETKKGIALFRKKLGGALTLWETFTSDAGQWKGHPLQILFQGFDDQPPPPGMIKAHREGPIDALRGMIADCDDILGKKEPKRYPRRKIIADTLAVWVEYTGKKPQKWAIQPSEHSADKEAPPYALCRLVLTIIEDCQDIGDFHRVYERAVKNLPK